jgi:hypothetical protein
MLKIGFEGNNYYLIESILRKIIDKDKIYYEVSCTCKEDIEDDYGFKPVYKLGRIQGACCSNFDYVINTNLEYNEKLKKYRKDI